MSSLIWKLNRVRTMSTAEILYRVRQVVHKKVESLGLGLALSPPQPTLKEGVKFFKGPSERLSSEPYVVAADRILGGLFSVFAIKEAKIGFPPRWNTCCKTGVTSPLTFGKTLEYRDERVVGDIKYLWEPARHLEVATLAQAWHLTGEKKYITGVRTLVESWIDQCPYPLGPHWTSSLEHSVRILNWAFSWHLIGGLNSDLFKEEGGAAFRDKWLASIYQHLHFIASHFSLHSSANNHLLGEYMGLLFGSVTWPMWSECEKWKSQSLRGFQEQALIQNHSDGVNKEQAIYYHHEVMDMMLLCGLLCRANGLPLSDDYWRRLESMAEFVRSLRDCSGHLPMIGDSDDAIMIRFDPSDHDVYAPLLNACAIIFDRSTLAVGDEIDSKSSWLFGDDGADVFSRFPVGECAEVRRSYPEGGYYVMGSDLGGAEEIRAVIDCAPLGYLSIAAHGHADALSLYLSAFGRELLIDPGTYAYHTHKEWRDYFRGTSAHNTLRIDGVDQSVIGGNFMWLTHASAKLKNLDIEGDLQVFEGFHDGYSRLKGHPIHNRKIQYNISTQTFVIVDSVQSDAVHELEVFWHLSEKCTVEHAGRQVIARNGNASIVINPLSSDVEVQVFHGSSAPMLGWVSRRFDEKFASTTVRFRAKSTNGPIITEVSVKKAGDFHGV